MRPPRILPQKIVLTATTWQPTLPHTLEGHAITYEMQGKTFVELRREPVLIQVSRR